jgi:hypothetical protein
MWGRCAQWDDGLHISILGNVHQVSAELKERGNSLHVTNQLHQLITVKGSSSTHKHAEVRQDRHARPKHLHRSHGAKSPVDAHNADTRLCREPT